MIQIKDLKVGVDKKEILSGISLNFEIGKNYCLLGKNGSGKSTLSSFLMGHPKYKYISGSIKINTDINSKHILNLLKMSPEERSQAGLFLAFQNVPELQGIVLSEYLRTIYNTHLNYQSIPSHTAQSFDIKKEEKNDLKNKKGLSPFLFKRFIKKYLEELDIDKSFLERDLNVGFSGGEKRKIEMLQIKLIKPKYIILDEIDSGLDLDAFKVVAQMLKNISTPQNSFIIITHYFKILDFLDVDTVYVIDDGKIIKEGNKSLAVNISKKGFKAI